MTIGRISTAETFRSAITSVTNAQQFVNRTQEQLGTGKKILQPSDDPVAAAQIESIRNDLSRLDSYAVNTTRADAALSFEEDALSGMEDVLFRVRDLTIQAQNPALSPQDINTLGQEVDGLLDQIVSLGNTQNAEGEYIFAGWASTTQPYTRDASGNVVQNPMQGTRDINIAPGLTIQVTDLGSDIFNAEPGNGGFTVAAAATNTGSGIVGATTANASFDKTLEYTVSFQAGPAGQLQWVVDDGTATTSGDFTPGFPIVFDGGNASITVNGEPAIGDEFVVSGNSFPAPRQQSVFDTLVELRNALLAPNNTTAERAITGTAVAQALENLDGNLDQISLTRTDIGVRLGRIEQQTRLNENFDVQLQKTLVELESLDYAEAISQLNLQLVALQAAQQTFVKTTGISLFNYL